MTNHIRQPRTVQIIDHLTAESWSVPQIAVEMELSVHAVRRVVNTAPARRVKARNSQYGRTIVAPLRVTRSPAPSSDRAIIVPHEYSKEIILAPDPDTFDVCTDMPGRRCLWPMDFSEPDSPEMTCCGGLVADRHAVEGQGRSYCEYHLWFSQYGSPPPTAKKAS